MYRTFVLFIVPAIVLGCCTPNKWEAVQLVNYGQSGDKPEENLQLTITQMAHVDKDSMMVFYNQSFTVNNYPINQMVWMDYSTGRMYVMRNTDMKCENLTIQYDAPWCVPKDAMAENGTIGAGTGTMKTTRYTYTTKNQKVQATVQSEGCIPLQITSAGSRLDGKPGGVKMEIEVFGVTAGISDPSVFTLPSSCMM